MFVLALSLSNNIPRYFSVLMELSFDVKFKPLFIYVKLLSKIYNKSMFKGKQGNSSISRVKTSLKKLGKLKSYGEVQSFLFRN